MEVSLKKAGFQVTTAIHGREALEKVQVSPPDLVLSETRMPELDGFDLCRLIKGDERYRHIPFVFLTSQKTVESKVKGLETGAEDYLTKPIYIKEVVTRARMILQKVEKERFERKESKAGFTGSLSDMGVVDLVQTFELGRKTGAITLLGDRSGAVYFRDGRVIDAELGRLTGESAFYRMLNTFEGSFEVSFVPLDRADRIEVSTQALLLEGMRRLDEWSRMLEQLPPLESVFELDYAQLADRLAEIPDEVNGLLRLFDGRRSLSRVVDDSDFDDLAALGVVSKLYFEGLIREAASAPPATEPKKPAIEAWLNVGPPEPSEEPVPPAPVARAEQPAPQPAEAPSRSSASAHEGPPPEVAEEVAAAEPELPASLHDSMPRSPKSEEPEPEPEPDPEPRPEPTPPAPPPRSREVALIDVHRFERRATPSPPSSTAPPSLEPSARGLTRARQSLLDSWSSIDVEGLESASTWAPSVGWARAEAPRKAEPTPSVESPHPLPELSPPIFGGAAVERITLPPIEPPALEPVPLGAEPADDVAFGEKGEGANHDSAPEEVTPAFTPPAFAPTPGPSSLSHPPFPDALPSPILDAPSPPWTEKGATVGPVTISLTAPEDQAPPPASSPPTPVLVKSPVPTLAPATVVPTSAMRASPVPVTSQASPAPAKHPPVGAAHAKASTSPTPRPVPPPPAEDPEAAFFGDEAALLGERPGRRWVLPVAIIAGVVVVGLVGATLVGSRRPEPQPIVAVEPPAKEPEASAIEDAGPAPVPEEVAQAAAEASSPMEADGGPEAVAGAAEDAGGEVTTAVRLIDQPPAAEALPNGGPTERVMPAPELTGGSSYEKAIEEARVAVVQQRFRTAVVLYRRVAKLRPPTPAVLLGLGVSLVRSETETGYHEAIPYLIEGLKDEPKNAQAWLALGIAYQNLGRPEESKGPYREYLKLRPTGPQSDEIRNALRNGTK